MATVSAPPMRRAGAPPQSSITCFFCFSAAQGSLASSFLSCADSVFDPGQRAPSASVGKPATMAEDVHMSLPLLVNIHQGRSHPSRPLPLC
jgi:hypothetical protein